MIQQHDLSKPMAGMSSLGRDPAKIHHWIDEWKTVRQDVERMLEIAVHDVAGHDTGPFLALIDEIDTSIRLLSHRVGWLEDQLTHKDG